MVRGPFACELITPNVLELMAVPGPPKTTWLSRLYASARNSTVRCSTGRKLLKSEKSMLCEDGLRTSGSVRPTFPKVKAAGWEKTEVLKYSLIRWDTEPESAALWPSLLGRKVWIPQPVQLLAAVTEIGKPVV